MARRASSDVEFLGMAGLDSEGPMSDFVAKYGLDFPQAIDTDGTLWPTFGVPAQPAWAFIDGQTGEVKTFLGPLPAAQVEEQLALLEANNTSG